MQIFILLILMLRLTDGAWAGPKTSILDFPSDVTYENSPSIDAEKNISALDKTFKQRMFTALKADGAGGTDSIDWLNRIYVSADNRGLVFVKANLKIKGDLDMDKPYHQSQGFVYHARLVNGQVWAFYFTGMSLEASQNLFGQIKRDMRVSGLWDLVIPRVYADETSSLCAGNTVPVSPNNFSAMKAAWGCLKGAGAGVWGATVGLGVDVYHAGKYVLTHSPAQTWNQMEGLFWNIVHVGGHLADALGDLKAQYQSLPAEMRAQVACETVALLGTGGMIVYVTGGATTPELLASLSRAMAKVSEKVGSDTLKVLSVKVASSGKMVSHLLEEIKGLGPAGRAYDKAFEERLVANGKLAEAQQKEFAALHTRHAFEESNQINQTLVIPAKEKVREAEKKIKEARDKFEASKEGKAFLMDQTKRNALRAYEGYLACKAVGKLNSTENTETVR